MADPTRAAQLVQEDSYGSRGIGYNERAVGEERLLFDAERGSIDVDRQPLWASDKGKGRSEDEDEDDMAWEPPQTSEQAHRRRVSDAAQHQASQHGSSSSHRRRESNGGAGGQMSAMEKRRIRLLWWKAAGINVLFILAWYTFSTVISVYSECCRAGRPRRAHY